MQRIAVLSCLMALAACSSCVAAPTMVDAGLDEGVDTTAPHDGGEGQDLAVDAGPDSGWTSEWLDEPVIEIVDVSPCEDWESVTPAARGLPADSTPRALWHHFAGNQPSYHPEQHHDRTYVRNPVVGMDGSIWFAGPGPYELTHLSRDGEFLGWLPIFPADFNHIAIAPDDTIFGTWWGADGEEGSEPSGIINGGVFRMTAEGMLTFSADAPEFPSRPLLAIGPGGMVYASSREQGVLAYCHGERSMWRLTQVSSRPDAPAVRAQFRVQPSGTLRVTFASQRFYDVTAAGELHTVFPLPDELREAGRYPLSQTTTATLLSVRTTDMVSYFVQRGGDSIPLPPSFRPLMNATDDIWIIGTRSDPTSFRLSPPHYDESVNVPLDRLPPDRNIIWLEDGSRLSILRDGEDTLPMCQESCRL